MKKLFLTIILLLIAMNNVVGQNLNNHWQLGVSDVNFSSSTPTVSTVSNNGHYGNASISDANGNLLFYTDGHKVWNKNHQIMQNNVTLNYRTEAEQPVIIVPYPGQNKYYIFTELNENLVISGPDIYLNKYIYCIVDFTNNPLGEIQNLSPGQNNSPNYTEYLRQEGTIHYEIEGKARQGGLTFTKNNNGDGYWVIVTGEKTGTRQKKIYSFSITLSGLNTLPIESDFIDNSSIKIMLKFGDTNLLGLLESNNFYGANSKFYTLNFNNQSGVFSNQTIVNNINPSGNLTSNSFEFSSDFQKAYFVGSELIVKDLSNLTLPGRNISSLPILSSSHPSFYTSPLGYHIQRDKYGNLLIAGEGLNYLSKINNPNSFSNSSLIQNFIPLNNVFIGNYDDSGFALVKVTLPQLIPELTSTCPNNLTVSTNVTTSIDKKQAANDITATNTISSGAGAIYHAGNSVTLKPTFTALAGSTFHGYVAGCTGTFIAKQSTSTNSTKSDEESIDTSIKSVEKIIQIAPNPNNGIFNIILKNDLKEGTIQITDLVGFTVYKANFKDQKEIEVNIQDNPKGIYIVKVFSGDQTYTEKIIKN